MKKLKVAHLHLSPITKTIVYKQCVCHCSVGPIKFFCTESLVSNLERSWRLDNFTELPKQL